MAVLEVFTKTVRDIGILKEEKGKLFRKGKYAFYGPIFVGFVWLIARLVARIFPDGGNLYYWVAGLLILGVFCAFKYSNTEDAVMNRRVGSICAAVFVFVVFEFGLLFYVDGHRGRLAAEESRHSQKMAKYEADTKDYNDRMERERIRQSGDLKERTAQRQAAAHMMEQANRRRALERRIAKEAGRVLDVQSSTAINAESPQSDAEMVNPYKMPLEPAAPKERLEDFLSNWEIRIRILTFLGCLGEVICLIYINKRSNDVNAESNKVEGKQEASPVVEVSPSLPAEASNEEKPAQGVPVCESVKPVEREVVLGTFPVSSSVQECLGQPAPVSLERKTTHICNKGYVLTPRTLDGAPRGWKVSYGVRLNSKGGYLCSATDEEVGDLMAKSDENRAQEAAVEALLIKKGKLQPADVVELKRKAVNG